MTPICRLLFTSHHPLALPAAATLLLGALGAALPGQALSQAISPPDPSSELRRQEERTQALRQREEAPAEVKSPTLARDATRLPGSEMPCFSIDRLQINRVDSAQPASAASSSQLAADFAWLSLSLAGAQGDDAPTGKCIGAKGIALLLKRGQDALLEHGLVTSRLVAQQQNLASGTLALTLIPGYVHALRFKNAGAPGVRLGNAVPIHSGELLNLRDVEQGLENLKRVPTAEADIQIEPSRDDAAVGQSDLVVSYQQSAPVRLSLTLDDSGSKGTGIYQGSATLSLDNPLGLSDLFYFTANHDLGGGDPGARGTRGSTMHYSLPLGYWLLGATYSSSRYFQNIAGLNEDYVYSGSSENSELKLSRLVYRDAVRKTSLSLKAWQRKSNNYIDDTEVQVQRRVVGGWEIGANHKEALGEATPSTKAPPSSPCGAWTPRPQLPSRPWARASNTAPPCMCRTTTRRSRRKTAWSLAGATRCAALTASPAWRPSVAGPCATTIAWPWAAPARRPTWAWMPAKSAAPRPASCWATRSAVGCWACAAVSRFPKASCSTTCLWARRCTGQRAFAPRRPWPASA